MISDQNHRVLEQLANLKATKQGHVLSAWKRSFHRLGTGAHCEKCYRMAYVLVDVEPPVTDGRAMKEPCP